MLVVGSGLMLFSFQLHHAAMNCTSLHCGPPLWYQFPVCAEAPFGFVFYFAVKVFNLAVGAPCNVLVAWHVSSKRSDASTSDVFIANLALLDAFFCLTTPVDIVNRTLLDDARVWYFQRFAYGAKDLAPLFLVSFRSTLSKCARSFTKGSNATKPTCVCVWTSLWLRAVRKYAQQLPVWRRCCF